jgi:hypothetical protein
MRTLIKHPPETSQQIEHDLGRRGDNIGTPLIQQNNKKTRIPPV